MRALTVALCLLLASLAVARPTPVPLGEFDAETKVWMARAMVAEAGWLAERDHVAIAYVLGRRWQAKQRRHPGVRLVHIIRGYCAGLEPGRAEMTPRQRWLRSLSPSMNEPDGWPRQQASWERHQRLWAAVLNRAEDWSQGRLPDPCRGVSWHWGGPMDTPEGEMYPVDCGQTRNTFYGLKRQGGKHGKQETASAGDRLRRGIGQALAR